MRKLLCIFLALYDMPVFAAAQKPAEIASVIHAAAPYGAGSYTCMWVTAYDATLWTDARAWSMQAPFALTLHYHMHFTSRQLADRSLEEMRRMQPLSAAQAADFNAQLLALFPAVNAGDSITALYIPRKGAQIFYNGKATGRIADETFAQRFLGIWLSEKTSAPDLRKQLLHPSS